MAFDTTHRHSVTRVEEATRVGPLPVAALVLSLLGLASTGLTWLTYRSPDDAEPLILLLWTGTFLFGGWALMASGLYAVERATRPAWATVLVGTAIALSVLSFVVWVDINTQTVTVTG